MDTINSEDAQQQLQTLIRNIAQADKPVCITSSEGNAIMMSEETYDNLMITLELLSTPGLMNGLLEANIPAEYLEETAPMVPNMIQN